MSLFNETPLLPSQFGKNRDMVKDTAKKLKLKLSSNGKPLSRSQIISKVTKSLKSKTNTEHKKKVIHQAAKRLGISTRKATILSLWKSICKSGTSGFGWWDNTQKSYCVGSQCAMADQLGSGFPYQGSWPPYASIRGPSFGATRRRGMFGPY